VTRETFLVLLSFAGASPPPYRKGLAACAPEAAQQSLRVLLGNGTAEQVDADTFSYEGRAYRGTFVTAPEGVIATVKLEEYLYSVVPREMPPSWPAQALAAQAIVARTFVLQRSSPQRAYDLVPTQADQVYTGIDAEHAQTSAAVDATAGQVLRFGNGFAQVMYSSCCGGHTESAADAWGGKPLPYLGGIVCPYCTASPWYRWSRTIPLRAFQTSLAAQLSDAGALQTIALEQPDASGRPQYWTFTGSQNAVAIKASVVRSAIGTRTLPSLLVHRLISQTGGTATLEGGGLGHGVGLCQWGARGMAAAGADAPAILDFYYPGTAIGVD
jgi:stage II sporulation protein D